MTYHDILCKWDVPMLFIESNVLLASTGRSDSVRFGIFRVRTTAEILALEM